MNPLHTLALTIAVAATTACGLGTGPTTDSSHFVQAQQASGGLILFSFADTAYVLKQQGGLIFGGSKQVTVKDVNYVGTYDMNTKNVKILRKDRNTHFKPEQGQFRIERVSGHIALLSQNGTTRRDALDSRHWLADLQEGSMERVDFAGELAKRGRAISEIHLVGETGAVLFHSESIAEKQAHNGWRRASEVVPELWLRYPDGEYVKIAATRHIEKVEAARVVYFIPQPRGTWIYDLETRKSEQVANHRHPPFQDNSMGVIISGDGLTVQHGIRNEKTRKWTYTTLELTREMVR